MKFESTQIDVHGFEGVAIRRRVWLAMWNALTVIENSSGHFETFPGERRFNAALKVQSACYEAARKLERGMRPDLRPLNAWTRGAPGLEEFR